MNRFHLDRQFGSVFETAGIGMGIASLEGRWLRVNPSLCEMLGYREDELLLKTFKDITHPDDAVADIAGRNQMLTDEIRSYQTEKRYLHRKGHSVWVQLSVSLLRGDDGFPIGFFSQSQNITARKEAEEALSESLQTVQELGALVDQARDVVILLDIEGRVRMWNQGATKLYGWTAEEAVGRKNTELYVNNVNGTEDETEYLRQHGFWEGEVQRVTRSGRPVTIASRATLMRDARGEPKSILVISTDMTEEKKNTATRLRSQRLESIGTLAGGIAHDLNNVLTPIVMGVEFLSAGETDPVRSGMLETMASCARRGADMIRQVLSFARGVDGERSEVQVALILHEIERIIRDTFLKSVTLECAVPKNLNRVRADATQIQQVLLNLAVNSRDAIGAGGKIILNAENIVLTAQEAAQWGCEPGDYVRIGLEDNGAGMSKETLDRIFDPFFTTKEFGKGTGLGLSTSLAIVKSHNGFMTVYSEAGAGSKFMIYLPALAEANSIGEAAVKSTYIQGGGECILIVDDEVAIRSTTKQILEAYGYQTILASGGLEALQIYKEHGDRIDVVLTDIMMPGLDGVSLIHALRALNSDVHVVAASGLASHADAIGAQLFLAKPFTAEKLLIAMHECLTG